VKISTTPVRSARPTGQAGIYGIFRGLKFEPDEEIGHKVPFRSLRLSAKVSFFRYWFPLIIYCILIFLQSSFPSIESVPELPYSDKLLHFFAYAVLGALFLRAYKTLRVRNNIKLLIILSILSSSLYGISDEIHQYFVPSRSAEWMDIVADLLGSVFGVFICRYISGRFTDKRFKFID